MNNLKMQNQCRTLSPNFEGQAELAIDSAKAPAEANDYLFDDLLPYRISRPLSVLSKIRMIEAAIIRGDGLQAEQFLYDYSNCIELSRSDDLRNRLKKAFADLASLKVHEAKFGLFSRLDRTSAHVIAIEQLAKHFGLPSPYSATLSSDK